MTVERLSVNSSRRRSILADIQPLVASAGITRSSALVVQTETSKPSRPPANAITMLSSKSCRSSARRPAPSARRIAISRRRDAARAISRFATLAEEAISSTKPSQGHQRHQRLFPLPAQLVDALRGRPHLQLLGEDELRIAFGNPQAAFFHF